MLFAAAVGMMLRSVPEMLPPYVADLFGRDARGTGNIGQHHGAAPLWSAARWWRSAAGWAG